MIRQPPGIIWNSPIYTTGSIKFTSTVTSKIFLETGFSTELRALQHDLPEGSAEGTQRSGLGDHHQPHGRGPRHSSGAPAPASTACIPTAFSLMGAVSYVTGSHNIKVGVQDHWGTYRNTRLANGDLRAVFNNGVPQSVNILNTPVDYTDKLKADLGFFCAGPVDDQAPDLELRRALRDLRARRCQRAVGRRPLRRSPPVLGNQHADVEGHLAARVGVIYDVFGNQKTAVKASFGKFMQAGTVGFSQSQNPLLLTSQNVSWTDLNGDGNPQGELGCVYLSAAKSTSQATPPRRVSSRRTSASWPRWPTRRTSSACITSSPRPASSRNSSVASPSRLAAPPRAFQPAPPLQHRRVASDFTPFTAYSPIDGSAITYYNISSAKVAQIATNLVDQNARTAR